MKYRIVVAAIVIFTFVGLAGAQCPDTTWTRTFGMSMDDNGYSVQETSNGGFVLCGSTWSSEMKAQDGLIIKTDSQGNPAWARIFGGNGTEWLKDVRETSDGGYVAIGVTDSYGDGAYDIVLIKTNRNGIMEWWKKFGGTDDDFGESVRETSDGGFILLGYTYSYGAGGADYMLIKTDSEGNELWWKRFGGSGDDFGRSVRETSDGGFILFGTKQTLLEHFWLIKTDAEGNELWNRMYGDTYDHDGSVVEETMDGGFILLGSVKYNMDGDVDLCLMKTDADGFGEWFGYYGELNKDFGVSVQQSADGGFLLLGCTASPTTGLCDMWLVKTDNEGTEEWNETFGGAKNDLGASVGETSDGGIVLLGTTHSYGEGNGDLWMIKLGGIDTWERYYGGGGNDLGMSIRETDDGGLILLGSTQSFSHSNDDFWLIKTDDKGNAIWNRTYGDASTVARGNSVVQTSDGGFAMLGWSWQYGPGWSDILLIKVDSEGNELWEQSYGGSMDDKGLSVKETSDGGLILTGYIGLNNDDVLLVKTDSEGNEVWSNVFGGSGFDEGYCVEETSDGGFIVLGCTTSYGAGLTDFWLIRTDSAGKKIWDRTYGGFYSEYGRSVRETEDGGFILLGSTFSKGEGSYDVWLVRTDSEGNELWDKTFGGAGSDFGEDIEIVSSGGFILMSYTESFGAGSDDFWLIKTDSEGNGEWSRTFGGSAYDVGHSVWETSDGGFVCIGDSESYGEESDIMIVKTDSYGKVKM